MAGQDARGAVSISHVHLPFRWDDLQSNPDAGDSNTSDSNGAGVWTPVAEGVKGKFVEVTADRRTRRFASRVRSPLWFG